MVPRTGPVVLRPFADTAALAAQARCTYRTTAAPQQQGRPGMNTTRRAVAAAAATILSVTVVTALPAQAGDREVRREGSCSGSADWKLKAKSDDGRIEAEGEVDSNVNGQKWKWRILHDGSVSARGTAKTTGPSGSFDRTRRVLNSSGTDRIGWRARNVASGQTCKGNALLSRCGPRGPADLAH